MKKVLLISVHGKYCRNYLNGTKTIEVRKTCPKQNFNRTVYIYNTEKKQIELKAELGSIIKAEISDLRHASLNGTGLSVSELKSYAGQKKGLFFLCFDKVYKIKRPVNLSEMIKTGITPPQSYMYIDENILLQALQKKQLMLNF